MFLCLTASFDKSAREVFFCVFHKLLAAIIFFNFLKFQLGNAIKQSNTNQTTTNINTIFLRYKLIVLNLYSILANAMIDIKCENQLS